MTSHDTKSMLFSILISSSSIERIENGLEGERFLIIEVERERLILLLGIEECVEDL
jgi:hypothetical protein